MNSLMAPSSIPAAAVNGSVTAPKTLVAASGRASNFKHGGRYMRNDSNFQFTDVTLAWFGTYVAGGGLLKSKGLYSSGGRQQRRRARPRLRVTGLYVHTSRLPDA